MPTNLVVQFVRLEDGGLVPLGVGGVEELEAQGEAVQLGQEQEGKGGRDLQGSWLGFHGGLLVRWGTSIYSR